MAAQHLEQAIVQSSLYFLLLLLSVSFYFTFVLLKPYLFVLSVAAMSSIPLQSLKQRLLKSLNSQSRISWKEMLENVRKNDNFLKMLANVCFIYFVLRGLGIGGLLAVGLIFGVLISSFMFVRRILNRMELSNTVFKTLAVLLKFPFRFMKRFLIIVKSKFDQNKETVAALTVIVIFLVSCFLMPLFFSVKVVQETNVIALNAYKFIEQHAAEDMQEYSEKVNEIIASATLATKDWADQKLKENLPSLELDIDGVIQKMNNLTDIDHASAFRTKFPNSLNAFKTVQEFRFGDLNGEVLMSVLKEFQTSFLAMRGALSDKEKEKLNGIYDTFVVYFQYLMQYLSLGVTSITSLLIKWTVTLMDTLSGLMNIISKVVLFLTALFYLVLAEKNLIEYLGVALTFIDQEEQIKKGLENAVNGIFKCTFEVFCFTGLLTWLSFDLCGIPVPFIASILCSFMAILPFASPFFCIIPACIGLYVTGNFARSILLLSVHVWSNLYVVPRIYRKIPGSHRKRF